MPLNETSGNLTTDAFGGGVAAVPTYIEDVFSTYLYDATGATQSITNNIDLSTKGGLIWIKDRTIAYNNCLFDTERGVNKQLYSNTTNAQVTAASSVTNFNNNGFTLGADSSFGYVNNAGSLVSWTFRKQPKFFDIQTWTGDSNSSRVVSHALTSQPGFIVIKRTSGVQDWIVAASDGSGNYKFLYLNTTSAALDTTTQSNVASTTGINVGWISSNWAGVNGSGVTFVAYVYASNAGGFGLTGTDNVISCGSYVGTGAAGNTITLGYEPQWLMVKNVTSAFDWILYDNMRGMPASDVNTGNTKFLRPNTSGVEAGGATIIPTATGFQANTGYQGANFSGETYIYIAIRRGPMKVPTDATKVFVPISTPPGTTVTAGFVPDASFPTKQTDNGVGTSSAGYVGSRLQGNSNQLDTTSTASEGAFGWTWDSPTTKFAQSSVGTPVYSELFGRAPSFFDEVCGTFGTSGSYETGIYHNLGVAPELVIMKMRNVTSPWGVTIGPSVDNLVLNSTDSYTTAPTVLANGPYAVQLTATSIWARRDVATFGNKNYVAYLFATCAGVSKVGSYTGNGTTQTINCGFTGGARFVLIKRTDATGDWWYWDTTRGMVAGNDNRMALNTTTVQTNSNWVYTTTGGFQVVTSNADVNVSGGSYIYLSIA
jgi:hypothetical protein